jgi:hypothetical protein
MTGSRGFNNALGQEEGMTKVKRTETKRVRVKAVGLWCDTSGGYLSSAYAYGEHGDARDKKVATEDAKEHIAGTLDNACLVDCIITFTPPKKGKP